MTTKSDAQSQPKPSSSSADTNPKPASADCTDPPSRPSAEEALVLSYLRKHGLDDAAASLSKLLSNKRQKSGDNNSSIEYKLSDLPHGMDDKPASGTGYDVDGAPSVALWGAGCPKKEGDVRDEARGYVEGFTGLITWILSLGDDPAHVVTGVSEDDKGDDEEGEAQDEDEVKKEAGSDAMEVDQADEESAAQQTQQHKPHPGLAKLVQHALASASDESKLPRLTTEQKSIIPTNNTLTTPPTTKPELLSLSFPLMVHTYCELLSSNLQNTARSFLQTYRHLYEPSHPDAISDLDKCSSTAILVELNEAVTNQNTLQGEIRAIKSKLSSGTKKRERMQNNTPSSIVQDGTNEQSTTTNTTNVSNTAEDNKQNLSKLDDSLFKLSSRLVELNNQNRSLQNFLSTFPFLRRVRALKWNVTISNAAYAALERYAQSNVDSMVMMSLLMNRCHLIVERRDPLPFPIGVLEDWIKDGGDTSDVRWAAPVHPAVRAMENGVEGNDSILLESKDALPYPKYDLKEGDEAAESKAAVEFNRALLVNGFRRLEALELKKRYEAYGAEPKDRYHVSDPLAPSVLLGSLCCSAEADVGAGGAPWAESHVGITSASICPPDGRKVAVGCDDAAVRIWSLDRPKMDGSADTSLGEPSMVLLGHKNGFPVFDVDWTRNGRTLLSAGGDGAIRLWDTEAVGPYGKLSNVSVQKKPSSATSATLKGAVDIPGSKAESMVEISGAALSVYRGHAPSTPIWSVTSAPSGYYFASAGSDYTARIWCTDRTSPLRVLSGHISPSVNCVTWHPNCNYVLTASDDKTCRMWDIQTGKCVRILSGSARGLNIVRVSPSGKYAAGAGYDNIVRIWDLGSGRLVNELRPTEAQDASFSDRMVNSMCYSSCGSAIAVGSENCTVKIWDVRGAANTLSDPDYFSASMGPSAISSGNNPGDNKQLPGMMSPAAAFRTNNISVLDLQYTRRNLLLAVGNYAA